MKEVEKENPFIGHNDPTSPLDIGSVTIEQQFTKLTDREKLSIGASLLGMDHIPVDWLTFLCDDYFLGNPQITNHGNQVFNSWKEWGQKIYPTPILTKYPWISLGGCIGSGKSSYVRFMGLYQWHRLDCCSNVYASLGMAGGTKIGYGFFHASEETSYRDNVQYFKRIFEISPYFKNQYHKPPIRLIASGPKSVGAIIGVNLIFGALSEIGFWKPSDALSKMNETIIRYQSRFMDKRFNFGHVIVDSSAKDADHSCTDKFEEIVPANELAIIKMAHWEARPELYKESKGQTFEVYRGDSVRTPFILQEGQSKEGLDLDRIVKCPIQTKHNFMSDIVRSLNDLAGIPYSAKDLFFNGDITHLVNCSTIRNTVGGIIDDIDFYDLDDTIYNRVCHNLGSIPKYTPIFIHFDIGLKKDICGVSICYYNGEWYDSDSIDSTSYPTFKFPLIFGISRKKGQSTSLDHLFQFVQRLSIDFEVHVSADTFASAGLFQSCERANIDYKAVSIDKTTEPAFMFKNIINTERATLCYNETLLRECSELRLVTNGIGNNHIKVDHPLVSSCYEYDYKNAVGEQPGSKDLFDAACGSLYACYQNYSKYLEEGGNGVNKQLKAITRMTTSAKSETGKRFQDMLEGIF